MSADLVVLPVVGIGDVRPGDDLAALIAAAAPWIVDGDVLVVTSKIVSKAEGRLVAVPADGPERDLARAALLAAETARVVATRGQTQIVQTRHGFVMASAGIDASNVDKDLLVLLPTDPDESARALRRRLREAYQRDVAVVVSDTMGRAWRNGLTDVALGVAGLAPLRDYRGETDTYGNELRITQMAIVDEICAAAELVKGKYEQVPVAVVRGLDVQGTPDGPGIGPLLRDAEHDMFRLGTAEARAAGLREAAMLPGASTLEDADPTLLTEALRDVGGEHLRLVEPPARDKLRGLLPELPTGGDLISVTPLEPGPLAAARAGADVARLRARLAADGLASTWFPVDMTDLIPDGPPLGVLATGRPAAG